MPVPLIKVRIFKDRAFLVDNAVLFFSMIAFVPVFFFASVYSQVSLGYDADNAGLYLLVIFAGFAPAAQIGGRMLDKSGAKLPIILGSAIGAAGFYFWSGQLTDLNLGNQWWAMVLAGAGIGLLLGPASTDATNRAINASYGEVTGITQTVRNYGSALGLAVLGTMLTNVFARNLTTTPDHRGVPADQAAAIAAADRGERRRALVGRFDRVGRAGGGAGADRGRRRARLRRRPPRRCCSAWRSRWRSRSSWRWRIPAAGSPSRSSSRPPPSPRAAARPAG